MIRTAIPFGYHFIALFLLAAFALGVGMFVVGLRRRSAYWRWVGAALCAAIVFVVAGNAAFDSAIEWNPTIASDEQIIGTWTGGGESVALAADHTFVYQAGSQTTRGTWTRNDFNLYLDGSSPNGTMRFIQFRGVYRLLPHVPNDLDAWDGDLVCNVHGNSVR